MLILKVNTARKTVNRKRFLGEHERTVNGFACRSMLNSNVIFPRRFPRPGSRAAACLLADQ
ncbi:MAG: hypothetical protein FWC60_06300 [Firmicutes bacterium]|nr:hypothetical protein [Bacillota bacterium]